MQYSQTTRFEQLTMNQLGKISYPEVFELKNATHVITAVLYGAQAFMVFDQTASENEDTQEIEGNLRVMVKKIPQFSIEGEGGLKMNENEKEKAEKISCIFYGDYELDENPTTYMEALQLYKKLPSLLRQQGDDAVPVRVWLHPLSQLDSKAAKLEREIGAILISKVEGLLEELELSEVPVITTSAQLNSILFNPTVDTVICFSFTSLKYEDPYLQTVTEFLTADPFEKQSTVQKSGDQDIQPWFSNPERSKKMKENLCLFKSFFNANKDKKTARFFISSISDPSNPGISIRLYRQVKLVDDHFQPVSKPAAPSVDIQNRNVILKLQKSPTGVTRWYRVEYRVTQPEASGADRGTWETIDTPDTKETFTLTGLQLANQYWVQYRAVSDVGGSEASEPVQFSLQGKVTVPVGKLWNWISSSLFNELRKKIMTNLGVSRWRLSTIESEVSNQPSDTVSNCEWVHLLYARGEHFCIYIHGDIFLNTFGLIEVDNVNMMVTIPAQM
ncbi:hypothetical protein MHYP_G00098500 [Metynnis hypsauchen]